MDIEQASLFVAMARSPAGKQYVDKLEKDYLHTVKQLLYAPVADLQTLQGKARALYEQLEIFNTAHTVVERDKG